LMNISPFQMISTRYCRIVQIYQIHKSLIFVTIKDIL